MSKAYSIASQERGASAKLRRAFLLRLASPALVKQFSPIDTDSQVNASKVFFPSYHAEVGIEAMLYTTIIERKPQPIHSTAIANFDISHPLGMAMTTLFSLPHLPPGWRSINASSDEVMVVISPG